MFREATSAEIAKVFYAQRAAVFEQTVRDYVLVAYGPEAVRAKVSSYSESDDEGGSYTVLDEVDAYDADGDQLARIDELDDTEFLSISADWREILVNNEVLLAGGTIDTDVLEDLKGLIGIQDEDSEVPMTKDFTPILTLYVEVSDASRNE